MTLPWAVAVMVAFALLILGGMAWGWSIRARRDRGLAAPTATIAADASVVAEPTASFRGFYVATTRHDDPLDRLAITHLGFRARAEVQVFEDGVALLLAGEPTVFIDAERMLAVGRATWTIDRVVEPEGMVVITWQVDETTIADSYVRPEGAEPQQLVTAIAAVIPERPPQEITHESTY